MLYKYIVVNKGLLCLIGQNNYILHFVNETCHVFLQTTEKPIISMYYII